MENNTTNPLVSIIMPLYNAQNYVAEAIQSVINQTYTNWELIVVNDGSTDNSLTVAKQFENDKIKIFSQVNKGQCAANNFGFLQSKGAFIKFFDADDVISANMIVMQLYLIQGSENIIASAKWGRFYDDNISTFNLSPEDCWKNMVPEDWICSSWLNGQSMMQCALWLIPRKILEKSGLWDESLSLINDLEFFTRVILTSNEIRFCETAILYYRSGLQNSLSGQKTSEAIASCYKSIELSTSYLLNACQSNKAKLSAANVWQSFLYESYPNHLHLVKKAEQQIILLIKPTLAYSKNKIYKLIIAIIGWKLFKITQLFIRKIK